ncbi:MAG: YIP1 family protein, partial [Thermoanaerobaculia bacterium]
YVPPPAASGGLPWETQTLGPQPFFDTAMLFIKSPVEAWRLTRETGDYMRPLLFGIIVGWVGLVFRAVWGTIFGAGLTSMIPAQYARFAQFRGGSLVAQIILGPLVIAIGLFVGAAILHVSFMIVGALASSRSQFEGTFRLVCYASVANVANVVPLLGGLVAGVWAAYLIVVGAQQLHKTTSGKALFGVILPTIVCCVCVAVVAFIAGAAIFSAFRR